ncbi:hypothetical protein EG68_02388 [Paragonimus skrjabini miyazakii]|uniref:Uncharacterized protein n=1 Tax=Paragonimus skrjabini miyazakii TaxID=59628 RepID=A0A8S9YZY5_9TREM|nr:hypothetical protein EG68_02388 [Paragonimus skrjabini miyazakii]
MEKLLYTNESVDDVSESNNRSIIEKLYQLQHEKESLKKENAKLQAQLDSADETIKDCFNRVMVLSQEVQSFSEAASERNQLMEQLEEVQAKYAALSALHEEQVQHSSLSDNELKRAKETHVGLLDKISSLERHLVEKNAQVSELVDVLREYENVVNQRQAVIKTQTDEIEMLNKQCTEMQSKLIDFEEQWRCQNMSNSNVGENMHNAQSETNIAVHQIKKQVDYHSPSFTQNNSCNLSQSTPLLHAYTMTAFIERKSLADELLEAVSQTEYTAGKSTSSGSMVHHSVCTQTEPNREVIADDNEQNSQMESVLTHLRYMELVVQSIVGNDIPRHSPGFSTKSHISKNNRSYSIDYCPPISVKCKVNASVYERVMNRCNRITDRLRNWQYTTTRPQSLTSRLAQKYKTQLIRNLPTVVTFTQSEPMLHPEGRDYQTSNKCVARTRRWAIPKTTISIGTNTSKQQIQMKSSQTKYPLISLPKVQIESGDNQLAGSLRNITEALVYDVHRLKFLHGPHSKTSTINDIVMTEEMDELQRLTKNLAVALDKLHQMMCIDRRQEALSKQMNTLPLVTHLSDLFERISTLVQLLTLNRNLRNQQKHQESRLLDVFNLLDEVLSSSIEIMTNWLHNITNRSGSARKANLSVIEATSTACDSSACLQSERLESGDLSGKPLETIQTENITSSVHGTFSNTGRFVHRYFLIRYFGTQLGNFTAILAGLSTAEQSYKLISKFQQLKSHPFNSTKYLWNIPFGYVITLYRKVPVLAVAVTVAMISFGLVFEDLLHMLPVVIYKQPYNTIQNTLSTPFEKFEPRSLSLKFLNMLHSKLTRSMMGLNYPSDSPPM